MVGFNLGSDEPREAFVGADPVREVYLGADLLWPTDVWDFHDDFERTSIGSAWTGSGGVIDNGALKKNTTAGNTTYWTVQQFDGDDFVVEALLGPVQDSQQAGSILWGTSNDYVFVEFSKSGNNLIGDYNGSVWSTRATLPARQWDAGDVIRVERTGTTVRAFRNGALLATGTSSLGRGAGKRRMALGVRMALNFFIRWYGPTFDEVRVRAN